MSLTKGERVVIGEPPKQVESQPSAEAMEAAKEIQKKFIRVDFAVCTEPIAAIIDRAITAAVEKEREKAKGLVNALKFYESPYYRKDRFGEPINVPYFYDELCFGDRAEEALKAYQEQP